MCPIIRATRSPRRGLVPAAREVAAVEVGVGEDRLARDLVEGDVLRREVGRRGDHQRIADPLRVADRPAQRLHAAQAAAHHRREALDAQPVGEPRLRVDPVLDGHQREVGAPGLAGRRVRPTAGPVEPKQLPRLLTPTTKKRSVSSGLPGPDHVVPPADVVGLVGVVAGDVVRGVERMADEHRVAALGVERAVGLVGEVVVGERRAAGERQRLGEPRLPGDDRTDRATPGAGGRGIAAGGRGKRRHCL